MAPEDMAAALVALPAGGVPEALATKPNEGRATALATMSAGGRAQPSLIRRSEVPSALMFECFAVGRVVQVAQLIRVVVATPL